MPGPPPSAPIASSEQDSAARGAGPKASGDPDDDDVDFGERATRRGRSQNSVVLSNSSSFDDDAAMADQPTREDANAASSRDLEEEEWQARLEAECRSNLNAEHASRRPETEAPMARGRLARPRHLRLRPLPSLASGAGRMRRLVSTTWTEFNC
jgi:hypothetical protein